MRTEILAAVLQLLGLAAVVLAGFMVWTPAGVALAGVAVFVVGYVMEGSD